MVIRAVDRLALVRSEQLGLGTRRSKGSPTPDGSAFQCGWSSIAGRRRHAGRHPESIRQIKRGEHGRVANGPSMKKLSAGLVFFASISLRAGSAWVKVRPQP